MPKPIKLKIIIKTLKNKGFFLVSQKGSHAKYRKINNPTKTVIIKTTKKEVPHGTFQAILLQANLKKENFKKQKKDYPSLLSSFLFLKKFFKIVKKTKH